MDRIKTKTIWITPEDARKLRDTCQFEWQRKISERNIERLSNEMKRGTFIPGTPIILAVFPNGDRALLNGNHTLEAVVDSGVTIPLTFIDIRCIDLKEAGAIYATLDIQKARTWEDTLKGSGNSEFPLGGKAVSAIGLVLQNFRYDPKNIEVITSRTYRLDQLDDYRVASEVIQGAIAGTPNRRLVLRAAILAVALGTAKYQPSKATEFWGEIARDDGLVTGMPQKALLRYMQNHRPNGADNNLHMVAAALAWNAFFDGRDLETCKPGSVIEFHLTATPWSRTQRKQASAPRTSRINAFFEGVADAR